MEQKAVNSADFHSNCCHDNRQFLYKDRDVNAHPHSVVAQPQRSELCLVEGRYGHKLRDSPETAEELPIVEQSLGSHYVDTFSIS